MKGKKLLADISAKCIALVAGASATLACTMFFYQPKTPANILKRLKK